MQDIEKMKKEIGEKIKEKREKLNLSQEQLADKLGYKSKTSIHKVEQGMTDLPQSKIIEFAKALNTTPTYLMGLEIPEEIPNSIPEVEFMSIPLYASVSAGYGSCQSEFIKMIAIPGLKPNGTTYFAVKVKGDSMEPKIPDNSTVIIKKDVVIENGDIGAFYYNGESYVKQKRTNNGKLILHSFNLAYESILVQPYDDFKEYGKVIKVLIDL
jgi:repressor LexA